MKEEDFSLPSKEESQHDKLKFMLQELEAKGLKSMSIYPGDDIVGVDPEEYYAELCRLLESIDNNDGTKLVFKDSRKNN